MAWVTKVNTLRYGSSTPSAFYYGSTQVNKMYQGTTLVYHRVSEYVLLPFTSGSSQEEYINALIDGQQNYQYNGYANATLYSGEISIQVEGKTGGYMSENYCTPTSYTKVLNFNNYSQMSITYKYREQQNYSSSRTHYLAFIFYTDLDSLHINPTTTFKVTAFTGDTWTTKVLDCSALTGGQYYFAIKQYLKCEDGQYSGTQTFINRIALS